MHTYYQNNFSIYFEVGNEENYHGTLYGLNNYQYVFGIVAQALQSKLNSYGFTNYHILTSGMLNPTAYFNSTGSCTAPGNDVNVADASNAIIKAENDYGVSAARLGVAVHPYHYNTNESGYWQNYYTQYRGTSGTNGYAGLVATSWACTNCGKVCSQACHWSSRRIIGPTIPPTISMGVRERVATLPVATHPVVRERTLLTCSHG